MADLRGNGRGRGGDGGHRGSKAVKADSVWYQSPSKPPRQPPSWTFGVVWTPLYASIAWAGGVPCCGRGDGGAGHWPPAPGRGVWRPPGS
ncbi:tryptophan-rich sensory protein [Actinomadura sp. BRA 177]|uniref:tryptophan-rich sensory protein n=1 Tax=Actinomadura sp. BRA 177 TaxID=2745202 RepID=UPI001C3C4F61